MTPPIRLALADEAYGQPVASAGRAVEAPMTARGSAGLDAAELATGVADNLGAFLAAAFGGPPDAGPDESGLPADEGTVVPVEPLAAAGSSLPSTPVTLVLEPPAGSARPRDGESSLSSRLEPRAVPPPPPLVRLVPPVPDAVGGLETRPDPVGSPAPDGRHFLAQDEPPTVSLAYPPNGQVSRPQPAPHRQPPPPPAAVGPAQGVPVGRPVAAAPVTPAGSESGPAASPSAPPPQPKRRRRGGLRWPGSRKSPSADFGQLPPVDRPTYVVLPEPDRPSPPRELVVGWLAETAGQVITVTDREPELVGPDEVVVVFAPGLARDVRPWVDARRIERRVTPWAVAPGEPGTQPVLQVSGPSPAAPSAPAVVSVGTRH